MSEISNWISTGLLGLILFFLKDYLTEQRKYQEKTEKRMDAIEGNYLSRFDEVNKHLSAIDVKITEIGTQLKFDRGQ
jgi:recombinational DNA repair ATPase RecF